MVRIWKRNKGSLREPLLYLGLISFVFGTFSLVTNAILVGPLSQKENTSFVKTIVPKMISEAFTRNLVQAFFVSPTENRLKETPNLLLIEKNSIVAPTSPLVITPQTLGILGEATAEPYSEPREEIIEYAVRGGDDLTSIANQFGISLDTLLWANNLTKKAKLKVGQSLIILPVSGVLHYVEEGDNLNKIAKRYKADIEKIITFNNLTEDEEILKGDILVIPDGIMPPVTGSTPVSQPILTPLPSSYFLRPVPSSYHISQRLHWFNAVDFSNGACGGPIYAVAGGTVQKTGQSQVAGKFVRILHPNKVVTFYGHLSTILVTVGQEVSQGWIVGYVGNTGLSTGCHLHFGVYGAINPFAK